MSTSCPCSVLKNFKASDLLIFSYGNGRVCLWFGKKKTQQRRHRGKGMRAHETKQLSIQPFSIFFPFKGRYLL